MFPQLYVSLVNRSLTLMQSPDEQGDVQLPVLHQRDETLGRHCAPIVPQPSGLPDQGLVHRAAVVRSPGTNPAQVVPRAHVVDVEEISPAPDLQQGNVMNEPELIQAAERVQSLLSQSLHDQVF